MFMGVYPPQEIGLVGRSMSIDPGLGVRKAVDNFRHLQVSQNRTFVKSLQVLIGFNVTHAIPVRVFPSGQAI